ncbi:MAG: FadR family transcriptional regulator [Anaerolineaceae bacterium]|nr:FadR family transcriptional regulator [Anaerolineaceae bacterium]
MEPINNIRLVDEVVRRLEEFIQNSDLQEGEKMPSEQSLCETLGVGRGTIREALRILSTKGYINLIPNRGAFLASKKPTLSKWFQVNELQLTNILEVRSAIEPLAVSLAIENCKNEDIEKLHGLVEDVREFINDKKIKEIAENDEQFHGLIASMSGNSLIPSINHEIESYLHEFRLRTFQFDENRKNLYPAHKSIVHAFDIGDVDLGIRAMSEHLDLIYEDLMKSILEE